MKAHELAEVLMKKPDHEVMIQFDGVWYPITGMKFIKDIKQAYEEDLVGTGVPLCLVKDGSL